MNAKPESAHRPPDRRKFLTAAGAAVTLAARSYARVPGSNARVRVGFLGCGGRAQAHMNLVLKYAAENLAEPAAVCDVWDGLDEEYTHAFGGNNVRRRYAQGLFPAAARCGFDPADSARVTKDYRRVLDSADVDVVCVATPDHWHAKMTLDAIAAGKDVFVETPMTRTSAEAHAVAAAASKADRVVAVAEQTLTDPAWKLARERIRGGDLGAVVQMQAGAFRNDGRGQWRFYRVVPQMVPATVDWDLFLGAGFEVNGERLGPTAAEKPFCRTTFAQWRCDAAFSAGPFSDLLVRPAAQLMSAAGVKFPAQVTAAGGLYHERDGRDVPDVVSLAADFPEGCQLALTATTASNYPVEQVIRCRRGAVKFAAGGLEIFRDDPMKASGFPVRLEGPMPVPERVPAEPPKNETDACWRDFLDCVNRRGNPICGAELGGAAAAVAAMGWASFRRGTAIVK